MSQVSICVEIIEENILVLVISHSVLQLALAGKLFSLSPAEKALLLKQIAFAHAVLSLSQESTPSLVCCVAMFAEQKNTQTKTVCFSFASYRTPP